MIQSFVDKMSLNPKRLFLIDGFGALISAFSLGVILVQLEYIFGMPKETLYILAFLPCVFFAYDIFSYLQMNKNQAFNLRVIAILNLLYCFLSLGFAIHHRQNLTSFGWIYFVLEMIIIIILVNIEFQTASKLSTQKV